MNDISKREKELEKISLTFKEIKDFLIKDKTINDEYRQAAIVLVRNVFSERQTTTEVSWKPDSKALHITDVSNLAKFSQKIAKQEDCPAEFIEIVNSEFWNLI